MTNRSNKPLPATERRAAAERLKAKAAALGINLGEADLEKLDAAYERRLATPPGVVTDVAGWRRWKAHHSKKK